MEQRIKIPLALRNLIVMADMELTKANQELEARQKAVKELSDNLSTMLSNAASEQMRLMGLAQDDSWTIDYKTLEFVRDAEESSDVVDAEVTE